MGFLAWQLWIMVEFLELVTVDDGLLPSLATIDDECASQAGDCR